VLVRVRVRVRVCEYVRVRVRVHVRACVRMLVFVFVGVCAHLRVPFYKTTRVRTDVRRAACMCTCRRNASIKKSLPRATS